MTAIRDNKQEKKKREGKGRVSTRKDEREGAT